jgi:antitoxin Phd
LGNTAAVDCSGQNSQNSKISIMPSTTQPPPADKRETISTLRTVTASDLKNKFGEVIVQAKKGAVAITRHQRTEFVLLPVEEFLALQEARTAPLEALTSKFDAMVARMNTPTAKRGVAKLFQATPTALGKSAVKAARDANGR